VVVRFLTLLLAVILMTGVVAQGSAQAAGVALVDAPDAPDLDPAVVPEVRAIAPAIIATRVIAPPALPIITGRRHAVLVFRPPR
jgi:hypothetical protein